MHRLRAAWRASRMLAHLLHGMAVVAFRFPLLDAAARAQRIGAWSAKLVQLAGLRLQVHGTPRRGATLLLANHVSWLDIAAIHAVAPHARFVAKAEVAHWPLLGWLSRALGTLFIQREHKREALRVVHHIAQELSQGETVAVFPEGTTGDGQTLLPFHANLLQAAIATGTPVQAVALRYGDALQRFSPAARFLGETRLLHGMWRLLCAQGLQLHVALLAPQDVHGADRRELAAQVRGQIEQRLHG